MPKLKFKLPTIESEILSLLCGPVNTNLNQIEQSLEVKIKSRGNKCINLRGYWKVKGKKGRFKD